MRLLFGLILFLALTTSLWSQDSSTRLLSKPPAKMHSTRIGGKEYVKGEVYLSKTAAPEFLKPLGFRDVEFYVSASRYNRYTALWPRNLNLDSLPPEIVGIAYDFTPLPPDDITITSGDRSLKMVPSNSGAGYVAKRADGSYYHTGDEAFPAVPDTTIAGEGYAKGTIYLYTVSDTADLRQLGFLKLSRSKWSGQSDPTIESYISNQKYYKETSRMLQYIAFDTYWPMDLDVKKLPDSVINLISDNETTVNGVTRPRPPASIMQYRSGY